MARLRVVHCLNQFFAGLGGEEQADLEPRILSGAHGPGRLLETLAPDLEVVCTVAFGDNWVAGRLDRAIPELLARIEEALVGLGERPVDLLLAGPAFQAGRYGLACAALCAAAGPRLGIPCLAAMHPDNPAVEAYRRQVTIVRTAEDVRGMREALQRAARVADRLVRGEPLLPERDDTIPRGLRRNVFDERTGAERAVAMLLRKLRGADPQTEYAMPVFDRVSPAPALVDPGRAEIALVTSGGIVPQGNPDRIESANAHTFGAYPLRDLDALSPATHQTVHGGYDPTFANEDPNRVLPLDAARELERDGRIGALHGVYYATVGNATSVERAAGFGREIARRLLDAGVQAVILTST